MALSAGLFTMSEQCGGVPTQATTMSRPTMDPISCWFLDYMLVHIVEVRKDIWKRSKRRYLKINKII